MSHPIIGRRSIAVQVLEHAKQQGQAIALQQGSTAYSYAELANAIISFSQHLKLQCDRNRSIALSISDPAKLLVAFLGSRLCSHNVLVLNPDWPAEMQAQCVRDLQPTLIFDDAAVDQILTLSKPDQAFTLEAWQQTEQDLEAPFYTGFTSGSEGTPKGFTRHENSWLHSFDSDQESYRLSTDDTVVCPGKLAHSLFMYASLRALYAGLAVIFLEGLAATQQRQNLAAVKSAILFAVPAQLQTLIDASTPYTNLRLVISAGAKLQPSLRKALAKALPVAQIMECYGSSELSYIALWKPADSAPASSVGRPYPGVHIRVVDKLNIPVKIGASGRLLVHSAMQFIGYAEPNNRTSMKNMRECNRYLDSGDTGYLDQHGFLFITGRSDRMMSVAGHSVFPEQIETALAACKKIKQVAVFPVQDKLRGQRPVAIIQTTSEITLRRSEIMAFAKTQLPEHAIPRHYYSTNTWPKTVSDKTDLQRLQALYEQQLLVPLT